jgi:hypothetical protein
MTENELEELERLVLDALAGDDTSRLHVLGYGEISVALGWPVDEPRFVCKRTPSFTPEQFARYRDGVSSYIDRLRASGLRVVDTTVMSVDRGDRVQGYVVQPLLDSASLGHNVLSASAPDPSHPFLVALADVMSIVTPHLSVDAQVTNFAFDGVELTLIDVGTPFHWDEDGTLLFEMAPFTRMVPALLRGSVVREMTTAVERWRDGRGVAVDIVANLHRQGLPEWVAPTIAAMNERWDWSNPIEALEAQLFYEEDLKTYPRLKRLQAVERWWQQAVRRRTYDFFIHSTFSDRRGTF